ncbi:MAG: mercury methylation corrinoid protein HgcA [Candidatus Eisenbacteria bacterium]
MLHTTSSITASDHLDHLLARWAVNRGGHRVEPGLHLLGVPGKNSPVFVTANYTLSFDALRSALDGADAYILVLDTGGINVWCAAGKGTFGTDELVNRLESTGLGEIVSHRELVLPQLGATGVSAHEVKRRSGFSVTYGPVRSADLAEFMRTGAATEDMRRVRFGLRDRFVLVPVELAHVLLPCALAAVALYFAVGPLAAWSAIVSLLAGAVLFPVLLPWLPTPNLSTKGLVLGVVTALPFAAAAFSGHVADPLWARVGWPLVYLLGMPQVVSFLALNFTGSTTFTSRTGVKREIMTYFPFMVWMFGASLALLIVLSVTRFVGGSG